MRRPSSVLILAAVAAMTLSACGPAGESPKAGGTSTAAVTGTASPPPALATSIARTAEASQTAAAATGTPATTATPVAGETGISGIVTVGPTCPVERADSPCPDRPYEARITIWSGTTMVADTQSGADGRFSVNVPPGQYRVVGESGNTFPHGTEVAVTVVEGQLTAVTLRFDSGIR